LKNAVAPVASGSSPAPAVQSLALPGNVDIAERLRTMLAQPSANPTAGNSPMGGLDAALSSIGAPPPMPEKSATTGTAATTVAPQNAKIEASVKTTTVATTASVAELRLMSERQEMRVGEKQRLALLLTTDAPLGTALLALRFDPRAVVMRGVTKGPADAKGITPAIMQSIDPYGLLLVSVSPSGDVSSATGARVLLFLDIEAIAPGETRLVFDPTDMYLNAADGHSVQLKLLPTSLMFKR
jgi:hypothetical protein